MTLPYRRSILSVAEKNNEVQPKQIKKSRKFPSLATEAEERQGK
jgi:hypothetical protein